MAELENHTLQLLREIRTDVSVVRREQEATRRELEATRRELDAQRREIRDLGRGFVGLSEVVRLQGQRLEQAVGDLRLELETTIRIEISGALANIETRVGNRVMDEIEALRVSIGELRAER